MKNNLTKAGLLFMSMVLLVSCKNENTVKGTEAQEVVVKAEESVSYVVNTETSKVDWEGSRPASSHTGFIKLSDGKINLDSENAVESGDFVLDLTSITVTDLEGEYKEKLESHLKGTATEGAEDFFNITRYPDGNFSVTGVRVADGKTYLQGNLTLKEITKNIEFPINISLDGDKLILQSEKFHIDRTQWGINYESKSIFTNLGDKFINDDVALQVYIEAVKS